MKPGLSRSTALVATLVAVGTLATACGAHRQATPARAAGTTERSVDERLAGMVADGPVLAGGRASKIYPGTANVLATTKHPVADYAVRDSIRLGVVGTVTGYADGPNFVEYDGDVGGRTTVMAVRAVAVFKGNAPASRMVYVQMVGALRPDRAAQAIPVGTPVALLVSAPTMRASVAPDAGRPFGEPVWIAGAQGLIVSNGPGGGVSYPRAALVDAETRLDELVLGDLKSLGLSLRTVGMTA